MAYKYITGAATTQVYTAATPANSVQAPLNHVRITINTGGTGTVTVIDGTSGSTANVGIITNPAAGQVYDYWDMTNVRIVSSFAALDATVQIDGSGRHQS